MKTKILLADDHKILREGIRSLIETQQEMKLIGEAESAQEAVQLAIKLKPDVVIMDISMPDLNGIDATRKIKAQTPDVKVLALSMHADKRFVSGMLKAGASGYLLKESAFEEMVRAIQTVTHDHIYISSSITDIVVEDYISYLTQDTQTVRSSLSARECEVLKLLAEGKNAKQVAYQLGISVKTVETHRHHIKEKLVIQSTAEMTKVAIRMGLVSID